MGKFLGHLVMCRGIETDPNLIVAVEKLKALSTVREVQKLNGMAATLNRFISRSSDKCHTFFQALKTSQRSFTWTDKCDRAHEDLKKYLS